MEPYGTFGRSWELQKYYAAMTEPQYMPVIGYPKAWTPGTNGVLKGPAVLLDVKTVGRPGQVQGQAQGRHRPRARRTGPADRVRSRRPRGSLEADLDKLVMAPEPGVRRPANPQMQDMAARQQLQQAVGKFLKAEGAGVILEPGRGKIGTVFVSSGGSRVKGAEMPRPGDRRRDRALQPHRPHPREGRPGHARGRGPGPLHGRRPAGHNIVAEIPGADKKLKSEIVMLGGHFDTWHAGTGATDDGGRLRRRCSRPCGSSRRWASSRGAPSAWPCGTPRSRASSARAATSPTTSTTGPRRRRRPEYDKLAGLLQLRQRQRQDPRHLRRRATAPSCPSSRSGSSRSATSAPTTVTLRNTGGTDHLPFDAVGLPGFQFIQDDLEYDTLTHHSNMDVYDHLSRPDLMQAATVMAWFVYNAAMRDEKLPRKYFDPAAPAPAAAGG
ncbi:MAG: hypothetical protein MZV63_41235 [Marinilabiliales bacterium]|nr:hypothetical protein [Marinilabiliales bacterium]